MSRVVTSAGKAAGEQAPGPSTRREIIARVRQILRDQAARDEDVDDALETVIELAKSPD